jgi:TrmH family RNA methyltransferase
MGVTKIESRDNPRLKLARKIREGRVDDRVFVEGVRLAEEAVKSGVDIEFCLIESEFSLGERQQNLLAYIRKKGIEVVEVATSIFSSIAETKTSQGIILICRRPLADRMSFEASLERYVSAVPLLIVLSEINNPSNLGAIVRTVEAAGAGGVIITTGSADAFSPKALRAAMGSSFRVPMWEKASIAEIIRWGRSRGCKISAATGDGHDIYSETDWTKPRMLIFGSEAHGITREILDAVDSTVSVPIEQPVESLNIAVAAGVILFEANRQALARPISAVKPAVTDRRDS